MAKNKLRTLYEPVSALAAFIFSAKGLAAISAISTIGSTISNVIGNKQQGQAQEQVALDQVQAEQIEATQVSREEARNQTDIEVENKRRVSYARAVLAAQGGGADLGLLTSIRASGATASRRGIQDFGSRYSSLNVRIDSLKSRGKSAKRAGVAGAFGSILSGVGQLAGQYGRYSQQAVNGSKLAARSS